MFEQLNEFKYSAANGKLYTIYFLKFWLSEGKKKDYIIKYQIRSEEKDFVWYARIPKSHAITGLGLDTLDFEKLGKIEKENAIKKQFQRNFIFIIKKGLDKDCEEANIEFVFNRDKSIEKKIWKD